MGVMRALRDRPEPLSTTRPWLGMPRSANHFATSRSASSAVGTVGSVLAAARPKDRYIKRVSGLSDSLLTARSTSPQGRDSRLASSLASGGAMPSRAWPRHWPPRLAQV